jgi:hypothetical protein
VALDPPLPVDDPAGTISRISTRRNNVVVVVITPVVVDAMIIDSARSAGARCV